MDGVAVLVAGFYQRMTMTTTFGGRFAAATRTCRIKYCEVISSRMTFASSTLNANHLGPDIKLASDLT